MGYWHIHPSEIGRSSGSPFPNARLPTHQAVAFNPNYLGTSQRIFFRLQRPEGQTQSR